jgi:hypothetical protein
LGIAQQTIDDFAFQTQKFRSSGSKLTKADSGIVEQLLPKQNYQPTQLKQSKQKHIQHHNKVSITSYNTLKKWF